MCVSGLKMLIAFYMLDIRPIIILHLTAKLGIDYLIWYQKLHDQLFRILVLDALSCFWWDLHGRNRKIVNFFILRSCYFFSGVPFLVINGLNCLDPRNENIPNRTGNETENKSNTKHHLTLLKKGKK